MAGLEDSLIDIPIEEWPILREKYRQNFPEGVTASNCLWASYLEKSKTPDFPVWVLAPFGNTDYGIVVLWDLIGVAKEISIYSLSDNFTKLEEALIKTKKIDWIHGRRLFCAVTPKLVQTAKNVFDHYNLKYEEDKTHIAFISKEKALAFDTTVPDDVRLEPCRVEHAHQMDKVWPHRYPGSEEYFKRMIGWGRALAVLGQEGDLRGWVLTSVRGDMHAVQVVEEQKRKGYAQLLLRTLGKKHAEMDREVFGCVVITNTASLAMFQKMGFEFIVTTSWIFS